MIPKLKICHRRKIERRINKVCFRMNVQKFDVNLREPRISKKKKRVCGSLKFTSSSTQIKILLLDQFSKCVLDFVPYGSRNPILLANKDKSGVAYEVI